MTQARSGSGRKTRWGLIASLTLNLLVAGVFIGGFFAPRHMPPPPPPQVGLGPFDRGLTEADRKTLTSMAEKEGVGLAAMPQDMERWLDEILTQVAAEPFDENAVRAALSAHRTQIVSRIQLGENLMVEWLGTLTPEARDAFVKRVRENDGPPPPPPQ
ncbi:periplasmic heavy metal sensor [Thioclava kandeliae]|uniref:Periplasmic heavy metal sensor n=1 Tax=Thioclava kandeliae TaxID=3070818 RepID=A0ABV1SCS5_9RHOB